jgi:hypothetical protein
MTAEAMASMGGYIVLAFAAAQFVAYFNWSNLGVILAINGAGLQAIGFTGLPLIVSSSWWRPSSTSSSAARRRSGRSWRRSSCRC